MMIKKVWGVRHQASGVKHEGENLRLLISIARIPMQSGDEAILLSL